MKSKQLILISIAILALVGSAQTATSEEFEKEVDLYFSQDAKFCWKNSYGRGAGSPPTKCPRDREKSAGLCYEKCKDDYDGKLTMCIRNGCPGGYIDFGLTCTKKKFGLPVGKTISKTYDRGVGKIPGCGDKEEKDGLLCYPDCKTNYNGVGPVCWRKCGGDTPVDCGAACATSKGTCASKIFDMVKAVTEMISNIVAMVGTGGASAVTRTSTKAAMWSAIMSIAKKFKAQKYTKQAFIAFLKKKGFKIGVTVSEAAIGLAFDQSESPIDTALGVLSNFDPIGIVDVVIAFKQDVC